MLLAHGTLVVIADTREWRLLRNAGSEAVPVLVAQDTPALAEVHHGSGTAGARLNEAGHATAIAQWLHHQATAHRDAQFVLIAPPRVLGEIRRHLTPQAERAVVKDLGKDLIGRHESEILATLRGV